jgi:DNA-binding MarR family transcriptional regulator
MSPSSPAECARQVLETVPMIMLAIRTEIRHQRSSDLSVPQFRVLMFLNRHEGASLSDVAEHLGLTLPSMSKMIDGLVARRLVGREMDHSDRRRITLSLTPEGQTATQTAYAVTQTQLAGRLQALSAPDRLTVIQAMEALGAVFGRIREVKPAT